MLNTFVNIIYPFSGKNSLKPFGTPGISENTNNSDGKNQCQNQVFTLGIAENLVFAGKLNKKTM